jgi:hypothetical protein
VDLQTIESTNLAAVGYDKHSQTLRIAFHAGVTYDYEQVPHGLYAALMSAQSKGEFFREHIKDHYRFTKINPEKERITMSKKQAKPAVQPQPTPPPAAPAPTPTPAATVAAPASAQPSKQQATIEKLMEGWKSKGVGLGHLTITDDGTKYKLLIVDAGWPTVAVGSSGGITVRELKSYASAFDAALIGKELLDKQRAREAKKSSQPAPAPTTPQAAPAPQPKTETPAVRKSKRHEAIEQQLSQQSA